MDLLQRIDPAHLPLLAVGCALLCVTLFVIGFLLQALSGIMELALGIIGAVVELLQGGPVAWMGCALAIGGLAGCGALAWLFINAPASCAAHPTNFCRWFGFLP